MSKIDQDVNKRVNQIIDEMNDLIKERGAVIHGAWVGRVAQQHLLMVGPGGTGKSLLARRMARSITGSKFFETAFDETTDPSQVFGPPDIKAMVEDGKTRRVPTNMLPEATDAFLDEFFNANGPLLHSVMPALNERIFHNNGQPSSIPLRQVLAGTNKLNADADQAALWDRIHLRFMVDYVSQRDSQVDMVGEAIARMSQSGRGTSTGTTTTTVSLEELDQAHAEALALDIDDAVVNLFFDIRDELKGQGIEISDRRSVEGMVAVLANAWIRNHESVKVGDLDILTAMWWTAAEQAPIARSVILEYTNPGEKAALDLLDDLDALQVEIANAKSNGTDEDRMRRLGVESVRNADKLIREAKEHQDKAKASGASSDRIDEVIAKAGAFKLKVGEEIFKIDPASMNAMTAANS